MTFQNFPLPNFNAVLEVFVQLDFLIFAIILVRHCFRNENLKNRVISNFSGQFFTGGQTCLHKANLF